MDHTQLDLAKGLVLLHDRRLLEWLEQSARASKGLASFANDLNKKQVLEDLNSALKQATRLLACYLTCCWQDEEARKTSGEEPWTAT